jgi:hypothetical protein
MIADMLYFHDGSRRWGKTEVAITAGTLGYHLYYWGMLSACHGYNERHFTLEMIWLASAPGLLNTKRRA